MKKYTAQSVMMSALVCLILLNGNANAERILSAEEATRLFSGNTYVARVPSRNIHMTIYAAPDGSMVSMRSGHKFTGQWAINDKGEICISYQDKMNCRLIMEEDGVYKKFKINGQGEKIVLVIYQSFSSGNIYNY